MALKMTPEKAILELLKKEESNKDTKDLWNNLQSNKLKRMEDEKGLIRLCLEDKHITRMWEIAACKYEDIAHLSAPDNKVLNDLGKKSVTAPNDEAAKVNYAAAVGLHADPVVNAMLPQAGQPPVKWIGKRGSEQKEGRDTLYFPWERSSKASSKGFTLKEEFEMTISNGDKPNEYSVHIGGIGGDNSKKHQVAVDIPGDILLSVERNPDRLPLPHAVTSPDTVSRAPKSAPKSCVVAFTFGVAQDKIIVYIRFAGPTMLVGKAFKANWAAESEDKILWGDLVLAKDNSN